MRTKVWQASPCHSTNHYTSTIVNTTWTHAKIDILLIPDTSVGMCHCCIVLPHHKCISCLITMWRPVFQTLTKYSHFTILLSISASKYIFNLSIHLSLVSLILPFIPYILVFKPNKISDQTFLPMHYCPDVSYPLVSRILHHFYLSSLSSHTCTCQLFYTPNKVATACLQTDKTESRQPFLASKLGLLV